MTAWQLKVFSSLSPKDNFSLLLEREEGRVRNIDAREKHQLSFLWMRQNQGVTRLGMVHTRTGDRQCLDQVSNLQPFRYWMMLQPTEPHQSGLKVFNKQQYFKDNNDSDNTLLWQAWIINGVRFAFASRISLSI